MQNMVAGPPLPLLGRGKAKAVERGAVEVDEFIGGGIGEIDEIGALIRHHAGDFIIIHDGISFLSGFSAKKVEKGRIMTIG